MADAPASSCRRKDIDRTQDDDVGVLSGICHRWPNVDLSCEMEDNFGPKAGELVGQCGAITDVDPREISARGQPP